VNPGSVPATESGYRRRSRSSRTCSYRKASRREWAERLYDIRRWTVMPSGGHFPAAQEPDLVARDIAAFFAATPGPGIGAMP
jgi:pimeloyl-ACP methyl ester carboxylesterase